LGVVSEQFPKGGSLTLSSVSAVGLIAVGVLGNPFLGALQDQSLDQTLTQQNPALYEKVAAPAQHKYGFVYRPLDKSQLPTLPAAERTELERINAANNQATLGKVAVLPAIMFFCYVGLIVYFRSHGGYREVRLSSSPAVSGTNA
jgi:DHA2 family metal-tetracycline-proton antiporter-like MFS transporter